MSFEITYVGNKETRMTKAFNDARWYLGVDSFTRIFTQFCLAIANGETRTLVKRYRFYLSMVGLQGAPARAMMLRAIQNNRI